MIHVKITVAAIPTAKPKIMVPSARRAWCRRRVTRPTQRATSGPNSGPDDHGADDQDRLVEHHSDAGDHGRHDHEGEVGDGEMGFLPGILFQFFPDHCIHRLTRRILLGLARRLGDGDVQSLDHNGTFVLQAEVSERLENLSRALSGDVEADDVA
jgi:hypothetical protein